MSKITIRLTEGRNFATEGKRFDIANIVSDTINRGPKPGFPQKTAPLHYGLDENNDWSIDFSEDNETFRISHRYDDKRAVHAISYWIAYSLGAEFISSSGN